MAYCVNCGADIGEAKFCPQCGTPVGQVPETKWTVEIDKPRTPEEATRQLRKVGKGLVIWGFLFMVIGIILFAFAQWGIAQISREIESAPPGTRAELCPVSGGTLLVPLGRCQDVRTLQGAQTLSQVVIAAGIVLFLIGGFIPSLRVVAKRPAGSPPPTPPPTGGNQR